MAVSPSRAICRSRIARTCESRIASRILWRVGRGPYRDERELYELVHAIDWTRHFEPRRTLRVDVAATRSPLASLEFATLRMKDAVCDRFRAARGVRPSVDKRAPDVRVHVYLDRPGGDDLSRHVGRAAVQARIPSRRRRSAAARESRRRVARARRHWSPDPPLLDPMCGSGTIVAEAALIMAERAPGLSRSFGFQKLAWYDGPTWQRIKQAARDRILPAPAAPPIFASDVARIRRARGPSQASTLRKWLAVRAGRNRGHPDARSAGGARRAARQSALRRAPCGGPRARSLLSAAGRRAEAPFQPAGPRISLPETCASPS